MEVDPNGEVQQERGRDVLADLVGQRRQQQWNRTQQRCVLRCIAAALYRDRELRGNMLAEGFKRLVPDFQRHFPGPLTDKAIAARGYNAWFYKTENPDVNPATKLYWEVAREIVRRGAPVELDEVLREMAQPVEGGSSADAAPSAEPAQL